ncbi:uncharacterized protein J8A68_004156 [[Candida] subhashii]|uniref:EamA domain-containing protein n=1 Tax=[Candida] subhashii TaxID=561895 RepID=A0A8J5QL00_9ASCO|nr:uncharacterized protein J8A68_004156 [[Candida] subhashii]KAG7662385.1 hypothetical protein J8A68_004156 [[Candida] subhashii]
MAITNLLEQHQQNGSPGEAGSYHTSKTKIVLVAILFMISLASFVMQTELTSQAYLLNFEEPLILLLVTHGSWWLFWPIQIISISLFRTFQKYKKDRGGTNRDSHRQAHYQRLSSESQLLEGGEHGGSATTSYFTYFRNCIVKQFHNIYHTSILIYQGNVKGDRTTIHLNHLIENSEHIPHSSSISQCVRAFFKTDSIKYVLIKAFIITTVLTVAGFTWYGAMSMTYAADVTAIYNCSAFTAYAFAIPLLNERFSWLKASSVIIAITGVFIVAYSGADSKTEDETLYPYRFWGNLLILIGAVLYGYYEVLYKKYLCIPYHLTKIITPRRQSTFANFIMGLFGIFTFMIVLTLIIIGQVFHIHNFNFFNYGENTRRIWIYISGSMISNVLFSASFLSLMALTSPVLSSVSSLLTIFLIGIVEWWVFGNKLGFQQLFGDLLVIIGFVMLTTASWNEISEGNEEDDVEEVSTYSFALSTEDNVTL